MYSVKMVLSRRNISEWSDCGVIHIVGAFGWYCVLGENADSKFKEEIILQRNITSRVHAHPVNIKLHHPAVSIALLRVPI
jgi:hypothetical protein